MSKPLSALHTCKRQEVSGSGKQIRCDFCERHLDAGEKYMEVFSGRFNFQACRFCIAELNRKAQKPEISRQ